MDGTPKSGAQRRAVPGGFGRLIGACLAAFCVLAGAGDGLASPRAIAAPLEPPLIIGVNDGAGWGAKDARKFHELGFTSERLEAGGPYTTIAESTSLGWTDDVVIVGNTSDRRTLSAVNIPDWTSRTLAQVRQEVAHGVTLLEVGNEMYFKGYCGGGCYQQAEPAKYAEMFVSLSRAVEAAGIKGVKLLFDSYGDYELYRNGPWSSVSNGGGWLATAKATEPELLNRVSGFSMHPYGEAGENKENDSGPGALKAEHEQAVALGFAHTDYYLTEFGVQLDRRAATGVRSLNRQAQKITAVYNELVSDGFVRGIWYYQTHDDPTGRWGLIEPQRSGSSPFVPRPSLRAVADFALRYEGPTTEEATGLTPIGVTLNGSVNPEGRETRCRFEYGASAAYGKSVAAAQGNLAGGLDGVHVSQLIGNLRPGRTYHFRLVAYRSAWVAHGADRTLRTPSGPPAALAYDSKQARRSSQSSKRRRAFALHAAQ